MGYTQYFTIKKTVNKRKFNTAVKTCGDYMKNSTSTLANWEGVKGTAPEFSNNEIAFNGIGDQSHESFCVNLDNLGEYNFCKTAYKDYDSSVVACLTILKYYLGDDIEISSDGDKEDLTTGFILAQTIMDEKQKRAKKGAIKLSWELWGYKDDETKPKSVEEKTIIAPVSNDENFNNVVREMADNILKLNKDDEPEQTHEDETPADEIEDESNYDSHAKGIEVNTLETILRAMNASSKDETRLNLNGVHLRRGDEKGQVIIEACDGFIAFQKRVIDSGLYNEIEDSVILSNDKHNQTKLKFILKEYISKVSSLDFQADSNGLYYATIAGDRFTLIPREFPRIDGLIPVKGETQTLSLDADLIIRLANTLKKGRGPKRLNFEIRDDKSPVLVNKKDDELMLIMPMRAA